ncbi:MAG: histidinol-phosphate transaminase [Bacteroidales bacterium]|nr:histidinol-phosphate transaminase [Bacteroidales bacterium]
MFDLQKLVRKNILEMEPYSSARDEFQGVASVYLDANENPYNNGINRYPDPLQQELKVKISRIKNVHPWQIFLGNGSDEPIDLVIRAFCEPGTDNIVSIKPTYGMYKVCANVNNVEFREVLLTPDFKLDSEAVLKQVDHKTKIIFLCSPNNPTGNSFVREKIIYILNRFDGIVVLDEAYIDFSEQESFLAQLDNYPNLVVLQTFSKAWGMAGARVGIAFASSKIIDILNKIKYPYNINVLSQQQVSRQIDLLEDKNTKLKSIIEQRKLMVLELNKSPHVLEVFPSDSNFLLLRVNDARKMYDYLLAKEIIVRDRSSVALCHGCLRVTIGTPAENKSLLGAVNEYQEQIIKP